MLSAHLLGLGALGLSTLGGAAHVQAAGAGALPDPLGLLPSLQGGLGIVQGTPAGLQSALAALGGPLANLGIKDFSALGASSALDALRGVNLDPSSVSLLGVLKKANLPSLSDLLTAALPMLPDSRKFNVSKVGATVSLSSGDGITPLGAVVLNNVQKIVRYGGATCQIIRAARKGLYKMPEDGEKIYAKSCAPYEDLEYTLEYTPPLGAPNGLEQSRLAAGDLRADWQYFQDSVFWGLTGAVNNGNFAITPVGAPPWALYFNNCTLGISDPFVQFARAIFGLQSINELPSPAARFSTNVGGLSDMGVMMRPPGLTPQPFTPDIDVNGFRATVPTLDNMSSTCRYGVQDGGFDLFSVFTPSVMVCVSGALCVSTPSYPGVENYNSNVPAQRLSDACTKVNAGYAEYILAVGRDLLKRLPLAKWFSNPFQGSVIASVWTATNLLDNAATLARSGGPNPLYPLVYTANVVLKAPRAPKDSFMEKVQQAYILMLGALESLRLGGFPGFAATEESKRWFQPGNPLEQQNLGYASFFETVNLGGMGVEPRPVVYYGYSLYINWVMVSIFPPIWVPVTVATAVPLPVPNGALIGPGGICLPIGVGGTVTHLEDRIGYDWVSVAEGYPVPRVWSEFDEKKVRRFLPGIAGLAIDPLPAP